MCKNKLNPFELLLAQAVVDGLGSVENMLMSALQNKVENARHIVFVVSPNGVTEVFDSANHKEEDHTPETQTCDVCGGDGYIPCKKCDGEGFLLIRSALGIKNIVEECPECNGVGDILCPNCEGNGVVDVETEITEEEIAEAKEELDDEIYNFFETHTHTTIIGEVNVMINEIVHSDDDINVVVIPDINQGTLVFDPEFGTALKEIGEEYGVNVFIAKEFFQKEN